MALVDKVVKQIIVTRFFGDGWGHQETFEKLLRFRKSCNENAGNARSSVPYELLNFKFVEDKSKTLFGSNSKHVRSYRGSFTSPIFHDYTGLLPEECKTCNFRLIVPRKWGEWGQDAANKRVCLHYAATGDHSFRRRQIALANPLARNYNIASVIVENPFYGSRKPKEQKMSGIRHVSDLFTMGTALITEGEVLFGWLQDQGYTRLGISGVSLGGHNASLTAAAWGRPLATIPCLSWSTAAHTFSEGLVSSACMWRVLQDQLSPTKIEEIHAVIQKKEEDVLKLLQKRYGSGSLSCGRSKATLYMRLLVDEFSNLKHYPVIWCPEAAIVVVAKSDLYVPRPVAEDIPDIKEIWPGCEVRMVSGGHITSVLTHSSTFTRAINDAFDKLDVWFESNSDPVS